MKRVRGRNNDRPRTTTGRDRCFRVPVAAAQMPQAGRLIQQTCYSRHLRGRKHGVGRPRSLRRLQGRPLAGLASFSVTLGVLWRAAAWLQALAVLSASVLFLPDSPMVTCHWVRARCPPGRFPLETVTLITSAKTLKLQVRPRIRLRADASFCRVTHNSTHYNHRLTFFSE